MTHPTPDAYRLPNGRILLAKHINRPQSIDRTTEAWAAGSEVELWLSESPPVPEPTPEPRERRPEDDVFPPPWVPDAMRHIAALTQRIEARVFERPVGITIPADLIPPPFDDDDATDQPAFLMGLPVTPGDCFGLIYDTGLRYSPEVGDR